MDGQRVSTFCFQLGEKSHQGLQLQKVWWYSTITSHSCKSEDKPWLGCLSIS